MPRNYNLSSPGGTNMVGRAYTPQVTPWDRDSDDSSVQRSYRSDYDRDDYDRDDRRYYGRDRRDDGQDAYYRQDLVPGYGDDRVGYSNSGSSEREDRHRAGHRKHWENRDPDYRYQYNDYQRADDRDVRRENQARYGEHHEDRGYRRENDRDTWMGDRNRSDYNQQDYDRDHYSERQRYPARDDGYGEYNRHPDDRDRGRWNRR